MTVRHSLQRRIVIVGTFIILAGLFTASDTLHDRTAEIIVWTEGAISQTPILGMVVFVVLAMLSAMVAFFSSAVFAPVAVYAWGKAGCLALLWLGVAVIVLGVFSFHIFKKTGHRDGSNPP